jgi:anhydro-N-acetylmuramic acid kinase
MFKDQYHVLGVMSGTSLDGLDIAQINFSLQDGKWNFTLGVCKTVAYSQDTKSSLEELVSVKAQKLDELDSHFTQFLGQEINIFIKQHNIKNLDAVCSHGHTAVHLPHKGITKQIGNRKQLAQIIGLPVVCDFRVQDVLLGGQGAPLVPIGDRLLFNDYDYCLNLGGFANVSYSLEQKRIAFDLCPVNIVLNNFANLLGLDYDDRGALARTGKLLYAKLDALNALPYYKNSPPKSLGLEWVKEWVDPILDPNQINPKDALRTAIEHIAMQIAKPLKAKSTVLVTGGGAYNSYLLERILFFKKLDLIVPESDLVEFKEALIFGLLGVLKLREEVNCLSSVTGAKHDHSSGNIFMP